MNWKRRQARLVVGLVLLFAIHPFSSVTFAQETTDWVTKFPREPIRVSAWSGGKKVAVSFALFVEVFGFGQGPVLRPDLMSRNPDLVNEAFRQYAISAGNLRVARLFKELARVERQVPRHVSCSMEGISRAPADGADRRSRHEQQQRHSAARARSR